MDELLKALAEAVRTGSELALPALLGFYFIRLIESIVPVIGIAVFLVLARNLIVPWVTIYYAQSMKLEGMRHDTWKAAADHAMKTRKGSYQKDDTAAPEPPANIKVSQ